MNTRPLTIPALNTLATQREEIRQRIKRRIHDQVRRGVDELNDLLLRYWPQAMLAPQAYTTVDEAFNYRGPIFDEIVARFEADRTNDQRLDIRWNPALLTNGIFRLQFKVQIITP